MQRYFRLKGALHPAAIGDGFVVPIFSAEDGSERPSYVQRNIRDTIAAFDEIDLDEDDVVLLTNEQTERAIGDRPLHGFNSRARGLLIGNVYYLRQSLEAMRRDYTADSSVWEEIGVFLNDEAGGEAGVDLLEASEEPKAAPLSELDTENRAEVVSAENIERRSRFVFEPLEPGYGITLGNALRRVLLSSIPGTAITAIKIENVLHEFSSIDGIREDVTDIVLNMKQIAIRMVGDAPKRLQLAASGPCEVMAGDIEAPNGVEILNPDQTICHLDDGVFLDVELHVAAGKGYVPAASNRPKDAPLGLIPIDALYSPVRQVSYKVDNVRIGEDDYDRLTLVVETNGAISPAAALIQAAGIVKEHMDLIVGVGQSPRSLGENVLEAKLPDTTDVNRYLLKKIDELELSIRTANCLKNEAVIYVGDLVQKYEAELLRIPNFGRKSLREIKEVLASMGLRIGMEIPGWPPGNIEEMAKKLEQELMG